MKFAAFALTLSMGLAWTGTASAQGTFGNMPTLPPQSAKPNATKSTPTKKRRPTYVVVDKGGPQGDPTNTSFSRIQDGINAVAPGGVVVVMPGVYEENLNISKSVVLQGDRGLGSSVRVIPTNSAQSCVTFTPKGFNDHAKISNIEFYPSASDAQPSIYSNASVLDVAEDPACINVKGGVFTMVESIVDGGRKHKGDLVYIEGGSATLEKNTLTGGLRGIAIDKQHALWDRAMLIGNIVSDNSREGIYMASDAPMLATGNSILTNGLGLSYNGRGEATVVGNDIIDNASHGVFLDQFARTVTLRLNRIKSNKGDGIKVLQSNGVIHHNTIEGNRGEAISTLGRLNSIPEIYDNLTTNPRATAKNNGRR